MYVKKKICFQIFLILKMSSKKDVLTFNGSFFWRFFLSDGLFFFKDVFLKKMYQKKVCFQKTNFKSKTFFNHVLRKMSFSKIESLKESMDISKHPKKHVFFLKKSVFLKGGFF